MSRWAAVATAVAFACPVAVAGAGGMVNVSQIGRAFSVAALRIQRGETVRFSNDDTFDHQIYIASPTFSVDSAEQVPGASQEIRFTKSGTFEVRCQIHPRMHLSVTVD